MGSHLKFGVIFLFLQGAISTHSFSQSDTSHLSLADLPVTSYDTSASKHSPKLATILSAALPGAGQVYNKKYWKVPIIYAGVGALLYLYGQNHSGYLEYRTALEDSTYGDSPTAVKFAGKSEDYMRTYKNDYKNTRDLDIILLGLLYLLNIVDATVDGHLYDFDIDDDLSLRMEPAILPRRSSAHNNTLGVKLSLRF